MMRLLSMVLFLLAAGCPRVGSMSFGVHVPASEIARDDLRGWIAGELDRGDVDRAFYGLEILKTRRYAGDRLLAERAARDPSTAVATAHRDLRPIFAQAVQPADVDASGNVIASRAIRLQDTPQAAPLRQYDETREQLFWDDLELYQTRVAEFVPYKHALRYSFAIPTTEEARGLAADDDAIISYFLHRGTLHAFVIRPGGVTVHRLPLAADQVRQLSDRLLREVRNPTSGAAWQTTADALYDALLAPIARASSLPTLRRLYIIPDGFLSNVPFALLREPRAGGRAILLERMSVSFLPSAAVHRRLLMRELLNEPPVMLAVGNPSFSIDIAPLPSAEVEARVVSGVFAGSRLLSGDAATEARITGELGRYNILHFSTHGVLLGTRVPGASSLMVAAGETDDGFLSAAEIAGLDLSGIYLAVLSACETGVSSSGESLDVGSLVGAFMSAGAPTVVGSLWKVSDESTTELLVGFYDAFLERGAGDALRAAQLAIRKRDEFAHPYFWAAFVLYGWDK